MTASLSLLVFLPLLFSVLAPLCLDGTLSWSWWWVCTPLFLFLLGLAVFLAFIAHGEFLWASVCVLFSLGFVGILCAKIENHFGSWYGTFTPLWISCAFAYVLDPQWPGFTHAVHWDKGDHVTGTLTLAVPRNFLLSLTIATVLLAIHLEQTPTPPFRVFFVFLPLLIYCGVTVLAGIALVE